MALILYFGVARDLAGVDQEVIDIVGEISIDDLWTQLIERHAALERVRRVSRVAADMAYASDRLTIGDASEIAIIPPVAGG